MKTFLLVSALLVFGTPPVLADGYTDHIHTLSCVGTLVKDAHGFRLAKIAEGGSLCNTHISNDDLKTVKNECRVGADYCHIVGDVLANIPGDVEKIKANWDNISTMERKVDCSGMDEADLVDQGFNFVLCKKP